jgi:hypothetical protein
VAVEERAVVQKRDRPRLVEDDLRLDLTGDDAAEEAVLRQ